MKDQTGKKYRQYSLIKQMFKLEEKLGNVVGNLE